MLVMRQMQEYKLTHLRGRLLRMKFLELGLILILSLNISYLSYADSATQQIPVKLFGQPCLLEGAYTKTQLAHLHSISPAQIPLFTSLEQTQKSLVILQKAHDLPKPLKEYQEKLKLNILAMQALFIALDNKTDAKTVMNKIKSHFIHASHSEFNMRLRLYLNERKEETLSRLIESYQSLVPERPEEEFHSAIERAKIRYNCSFDAR